MVRDEKIKNFMVKSQVGDFETLYKQISEIKIKDINFEGTNKKNAEKSKKMKTILFVYREIFDFPGDDREISVFVSKHFVSSVIDILFCDTVVHHSHVSGNTLGYAHDFCNPKVKEIYQQAISVFTHNLG